MTNNTSMARSLAVLAFLGSPAVALLRVSSITSHRAHLPSLRMQLASNDADLIAAEWQEEVAGNPRNVQNRVKLGLALEATGDLKGALSEFQAAVTIAPTYAKAVKNVERLTSQLAEDAQSVVAAPITTQQTAEPPVPLETQTATGAEDPTAKAKTSVDNEAAVLKSKIFAACATSDRGFAASPSDRAAIEALLADLSPLSPTAIPSSGVAPEDDANAPLRACWRLVYTSASDVSTLGANPFVSVGGIYQDARDLPIIMNVIDVFPRALQNLPPGPLANSLATSARLNVQTRARPRSATRVGLTFEAVEVQPLSILGNQPPSWFPSPPKLDFPQLGLDLQRQIFGVTDENVDPRDAPANPAYFDILYLDDDFLVIQQGSPGGMFAAVKVDELAT